MHLIDNNSRIYNNIKDETEGGFRYFHAARVANQRLIGNSETAVMWVYGDPYF